MSEDNKQADERAAFEAHIANECEIEDYVVLVLQKSSTGTYTTTRIQGAWEGWKARAALSSAPIAPQASNAEDWRKTAADALYCAAITCEHVISDDEVILRRDDRKDGNALSQLADRIAAAYESISAPIAPAQPEQKPLGWLNSGELEHARKFGGSVNLWLKQWGLKEDVPVFLNAAPAQDEETFDRQKEEWRHDSEELEALHMCLDKAELSRADKSGEIFSAWGRVLRYVDAQITAAHAAGFAQCKEMAGAACFERADNWQQKISAIPSSEWSPEAEKPLKALRDEAEACKTAIRALQCPDQPAEAPKPYNFCRTCKFRNGKGFCTSDKLAEDMGELGAEKAHDMLVYEHQEGGGFWVGEDFGCVHHEFDITGTANTDAIEQAPQESEQAKCLPHGLRYQMPPLELTGHQIMHLAAMAQSADSLDSAWKIKDLEPKSATHDDEACKGGIGATTEGQPGWALLSTAFQESEQDKVEAIKIAYGYLWHVNSGQDAPSELNVLTMTPEAAAYKARRHLRDLLTNEERGNGINAVREIMTARAAQEKA